MSVFVLSEDIKELESLTPEVRQALQEIFEMIPGLVGKELLERTVTFHTIMEVKKKIMLFFLGEEVCDSVVRAMSDKTIASYGWGSRETVRAGIKQLGELWVNVLDRELAMPVNNDRDLILNNQSKNLKINPSARELYQEGGLTVARLLEVNPGVILVEIVDMFLTEAP